MRAVRVCNKDYVATAFLGEGPYLYGGRWNTSGVRVVYLGGSPSIAALEILVHLPSLVALSKLEFVMIPVDFDDKLVSQIPGPLPGDWNHYPAPASTAAIGGEWIASARSLILEVPSAVLEIENNYLLNPAHPDIGEIVKGDPAEFIFDLRLKQLVATGVEGYSSLR